MHAALRVCVLVALTLLLATGCAGGDDEPDAAGRPAADGASLFTASGCGDCHTFAAADSTGTVGPNLDQLLRPSEARVARQVRDGGNGMPSFKDRLSNEEIRAVATFVAGSAGSEPGRQTAFKPDGKTVARCESSGCYQQAFGNLAFRQGPRVALDRLDALQSRDELVRSNCHPIAHMIGAGGLLHFKGAVGKAFAAGTATCASGYYHGLLQWKLNGLSEEDAAEVALTACNDPDIDVNRFNYYQCVHGLGHGVMLYQDYELPAALDMCHELQTEFDRTSCSGGVFMENLSSSFGIRSKWLREDDLLYPCPTVEEQDKLYCYLLVSSRILPAVGWNWKKAAEWCRRSEKDWIGICFQSYGRDASGSAQQRPRGTAVNCAQAGSGEKDCIFGAVRDIVNNDADDLGARELCTIVEARYRSHCFYGIGTILGTQHSTAAARRGACSRFARGRDLADCVRGVGS